MARRSWPDPARVADYAAAGVTRATPTKPRRELSHMARLSQVFLPRDREFFDLFEEAGGNIQRAAELLEQMLRDYPEKGELASEILIYARHGDSITQAIVQPLNN